MPRLNFGCVYVALPALLFFGCSGREPTYPVSGKVLYKGEGTPAVSGVYVVFESTKDPYPRAMGKINADGSFTLSTDRPDNGAIQGPHRICIQPTSADGSGMDLTPQISKKINPKYFEFRTSGLTYDIKPGENKDILVEVERPK